VAKYLVRRAETRFMLIINADDLGFNRFVTDRILACYENRRISSASAMVFMADSERSAELALNSGLDVGLHLNFTDRFTAGNRSSILHEYQQHISDFLLKNKYYLVLYNPFLRRHFEYIYRRQYEEFIRLYERVPAHVNGHHHMHLCTNILIDKLIPIMSKVRKSFSFYPSERGYANWFYRYAVDFILKRRYVCTDYFFSISPIHQFERFRNIVELSQSFNVELMIHSQNTEEFNFVMNTAYIDTISGAKIGTYQDL
jgi:chitin disaccharide deacetylase